MKKISNLVLSALATSIFACTPAPKEEAATEEAVQMEETASADEEKSSSLELVGEINKKRAAIEASLGEAMVLSTAELREKIKQKWEKIHFYTADGQVVRIKSYPYKNITHRTEEFYLENGELILAVIEDDGQGERGKDAEHIDKMYYYRNGNVVAKIEAGGEDEYSVKDSDAEELLSEVNEYLELFKVHFSE